LLQLQEALLSAPSAAGASSAGADTDMQQDDDAAGDADVDAVRGLPPLTDKQRALACEALAAADKDLADGANDFVQLLNVAARLQQAMA
jgi:hypothetical protein